jgi:acyl carrier protein
VARELRPADASAAVVPIGTPLPNVRVSVVDAEGVPCPVGAVGELLVGGPTLADGYLGLPDATAAAFPADLPWSEPGTRWYRTGDRARWRADGALECLGRIDSQVKLRGFRIEPEEIESALRALPGVADAAACVVGEAARARLTGFVVADGAVEPAALLAGLAERLPAHLVPAGVVVLPGLPHTVSGKVDRRALAALAAGTDAGGRAPRNAAEALMAEIWQRALGLDRVAVDANFFELGGHSLAAMQVLSLLHTRTGVELGVRALFEAPTIAELVELAGLGAADESTLDQEAGAELRRDPGLPLSFGQERIWQMDQRQPGATFFNCVTTLRLRGELDPGALRFAFDRLVERHEALRTTIETRDGRPVQRIWDPLAVPIDVRDVSAMDAEGRAAAVRAAVAAETTTPISLYDKPFARARLLRLAAAEHVLVVTFHHAAIDDWTDRVLATEFAALYRAGCEGVAPDLPETTVQYADFASWQRRTLSGDALRDGVEGWRKALAGVAFDSDPPADREPPEPPTHRAAIVRDQLSERTTELLRADWARRRVTSYMATLAAYQVLLAAESGSRDVCVESPMANRTDWRIERMVGYLVNPVLLRLDLRGDPRWSRILELARESCLHAFAHQHVPFAEVVHMLSDTRDLFRFPVAKFILVNETGGLGRDLPGLDVEVLESAAAPQSKNRYLMTVVERRRALGVEILFNTDQIDMPHARRAAAAYRVLLDRVATDDPPLSELIELVRFSLGDTNS